MYIELAKQFSDKKRQIWEAFIKNAGLVPDQDVTQTALLWDDDELVASGSRNGNLLKCIAVAQNYQGQDLTSSILSALRQEAFKEGHSHLFLYTKPENETLFSSLFFYPVAKTDKVLLMENRKEGVRDFIESMPLANVCGKIGALVMNCNPFTLGHQYLIETASKECDHLYVFVVAEDKSRFSFEQRIEMVRLGTAHLDNVSVFSTGPYLISSTTFPTYFLKERENVSQVQCLLDIEIFTKYFVPRFCINTRFVGTEPLSPMTNLYNQALKENLPEKNVEVKEIARLELMDEPISASRVRKLIDEGKSSEVEKLVPKTTFNFLKSNHLI